MIIGSGDHDRGGTSTNRRTIDRWVDTNLVFAAKYARARTWQAEYMDDLIMDTAVACTPETAPADRVKINAFQWRAARLAPKVFGDKSEVAVSGADRGPVRSEIRIPLDPIEASQAYQRMMRGDK